MALTYAQFNTTVANLLSIDESFAPYVQILPMAISYAEDRIYREMDLLATRVTDTGNVTANNRNFTLPSNFGKFVVIEQINIFTPVSTTTTRNQVTPVSLDVVNNFWPSDTAPAATSVPVWFAVTRQESDGDTVVTFGPAPGAAFTAEVIGTIQPTALSVSNTTTYLSTFLPDLLIAATMVFMAGFQKNFGSQADDPKMAMSWETQYQTLFKSAFLVEGRKKFSADTWTSKQPEPVTNQRG